MAGGVRGRHSDDEEGTLLEDPGGLARFPTRVHKRPNSAERAISR